MGIKASVLARIRKGAALLDTKRPGWAKKIKPERLDLSSCSQCVLGQLYRRSTRDDGFVRGTETLDLSDPGKYGFDLPVKRGRSYWGGYEEQLVEGATYEELDKGWLFEIGRRVNGRIRGA